MKVIRIQWPDHCFHFTSSVLGDKQVKENILGCLVSLGHWIGILSLKLNNKFHEILKDYCEVFKKGQKKKTERKGENHSNQCQHPQLWAINYNFRMLSFYFFPPCTPCEPHLSGQGEENPLATGSPGHSTFLWCSWAKEKKITFYAAWLQGVRQFPAWVGMHELGAFTCI